MPYLTNYHLAEQNAYALLGPIAETLRELEQRTQHYVDRLAMEIADQDTLRAARQALAAAHAEIERLRDASAPWPTAEGEAEHA